MANKKLETFLQLFGNIQEYLRKKKECYTICNIKGCLLRNIFLNALYIFKLTSIYHN